MSVDRYRQYRETYLNAPKLNLTSPVDVSLELSSVCNMACSYCLDPETPVLGEDFKWKPIKDFKLGERIIAFDEESPATEKQNRKMRKGIIEKSWDTEKDAIKITTSHGEVTCSIDHKFLDTSSRWREAGRFKIGDTIKFAESPWHSADTSNRDYMRGYLQAMTIGDGTARWKPLPGATTHASDHRRQIYWRVALKDFDCLDRIVAYLDMLRIDHPGIKVFSVVNGSYAEIRKIELRSKASLSALHDFMYVEPISSQSQFECGYLAGIFDAEGTNLYNCVRISQKQNNGVLDLVSEYMANLGFRSTRTNEEVRLLGGMWSILKFLGIVQPAIKRQCESWDGKGVRHIAAEIVSIEPLGKRKLKDIQTSTATFYGAGFPTHNCYHADKKNLPFKQQIMKPETIKAILRQAADAGVNSVKFNWRGESTLNPFFCSATSMAKQMATGSTFIDRLTNSNFKFDTKRDDLFTGLCHQTKVKVSYDSFIPEVFEGQRHKSDHALTTANIDRFYNWPGRDNILVIQAVRTSRNANEDLEGQAKKRWPSALLSIRDMVQGRVDRDLSDITHKERDYSERQSCIQAHARLIFDWNGEAVPCCPDIKQGLKLGNIHEKKLVEIFNSDRAMALRRDLLSLKAFESSPCKDCSSFETFAGYKASYDS